MHIQFCESYTPFKEYLYICTVLKTHYMIVIGEDNVDYSSPVALNKSDNSFKDHLRD